VGDGFLFDQSETPGSRASYDDYVYVALVGGQVRFQFLTANDPMFVLSPDTYDDGEWHLVSALRVAPQVGELYIDGKYIGTDTSYGGGNGFNLGTGYTIGAETDLTNSLNGSIDSVMIYSRALSVEEIQLLYMSNLHKIGDSQWNVYINQTKNATANLDSGTYNYKIHANYSGFGWNSTEQRTITIT
jgi:hypothetical protein